MKKNFFLLMGIAAVLTACEKTTLSDEDMTTYDGTEQTRITFTVTATSIPMQPLPAPVVCPLVLPAG